MSGAYEYELPANAKARMELDGSALVFQVSAVNAGKRLPVGFMSTMEPAALMFTGLSFLLHMGLIAVFAFFMPRMNGDDSEDIDRDQILMMQKLLECCGRSRARGAEGSGRDRGPARSERGRDGNARQG